MRLGCFLGCQGEIAEIGSLLRGAFRPEDEKLASILRGVRAMWTGIATSGLIDEKLQALVNRRVAWLNGCAF